MDDHGVARLVADMLSWRRARQPEPADARLALAVLARVGDGAAVPWDELLALAEAAGDAGPRAVDDAHARAERVAALAECDDDNTIVGIHGLGLTPTAYTLALPGGRRGTWCALDTLFLPPLLGQDAAVTARCAVTGAPVSLRVSAEGQVDAADPPTLALTVPIPDLASPPRHHDELRATFCARSRFAWDAVRATALTADGSEMAVLDLKSAGRVGRGIAEGLRTRTRA